MPFSGTLALGDLSRSGASADGPGERFARVRRPATPAAAARRARGLGDGAPAPGAEEA
eukprot:CAMPEP_0204517150 /NCGR_PEP_ID=MMETSP0661-20131031/3521_1 /ASSEMBLY_ACC=CAM_ASM_000606 /TAXON_ID=109239 /ORGANISM="Alexandrium margalefi, Strain AMGDE01CS-322" /LENGTH=57 /DNA_ID=CAMNT_0051522539 /DNA_START=145 /DNA_END=315 /DNA_ORIENTATION=+